MSPVRNPRIVGIHGAPRSGTSWLGQIFNSHEDVAYRYQPFFAYAFRGRITTKSNAVEIRRFFDDLLVSQDEFVTQSGAARLAREAPMFSKRPPSCLVYKEVRFHNMIGTVMELIPDARYVGIVRDPRSVLASWFGAPREFRPEWSLRDEWRKAPLKNAGLEENWYGYARWKELARLFLDLRAHWPDRFRVVRYEDLVRAPLAAAKSMFEFCGLVPGEQTVRFIHDSTSRDDEDPYGVFRRPKAERPGESIPGEIAREIEDDLGGTALEQFLASDSSAR